MTSEAYRDPFQSTPRRGDFADHGAYQKPLVPVEERIELRIARILKDGGETHRVFEVECVGHSVRFTKDKEDPELNPLTDILICRRDVQSPGYKVHLNMGDGTVAPVSLKLPIEVPRMVLKVYRGSFDANTSVSGNAHVNAPICWGSSAYSAVKPYGFELGDWSLSRYIAGMTFGAYLEATKGPDFDPEAVWADRCYCLAGVADRLAEMRTVKGIWIHSDVKPRNIVVRPLTQDGVRPRRSVELIDSDTLVFLPIAYGGALTPVSAKGCTPRFAAPETLLRGLAERSSDIWSFGVLVYDALVGSHPFGDSAERNGRSFDEIYRSNAEPQLDALASYEARSLVKRCLDKNPLKRPEPAWLALQLREMASRPPAGYVPQGPSIEDATTEFAVDKSRWRSRYCIDLDALLPEIEQKVDSEPEPESEATIEREVEPEQVMEAESEQEAEAELESKTEAVEEVDAEDEPELEMKALSEPETEAEPESELELVPEAEPVGPEVEENADEVTTESDENGSEDEAETVPDVPDVVEIAVEDASEDSTEEPAEVAEEEAGKQSLLSRLRSKFSKQ